MPPSSDVLISSSAPILANGADGLEESSPIPECHGSEAEFRNQEARIAKRCVFHDALRLLSTFVRHENKRRCSQGSSGFQRPCHSVADEDEASTHGSVACFL